MPVLKIGRQGITYREQGEGRPPVLLLHGAGGSSLHFAELVTPLGRHRRTVALDLPGHGSSDPLEIPPSPDELLERYRDLVAEAAERLGLGRFVLVGHSMGGAIALQFALAFPDRLSGLVLVATSARLKVAPTLLATIRQNFDELPTLMAAMGYSAASDQGQVEAWAQRQIQAPQDVVLADFMACARFDLRHRVGSLSCPTLVVSAADDRLTPPELQQQLVALIPRARLEILSRAGHFLLWERPVPLARLILGAAGVTDEGGGRGLPGGTA
jgi:pimeloyl-ACP methyl ester carboxylesterase